MLEEPFVRLGARITPCEGTLLGSFPAVNKSPGGSMQRCDLFPNYFSQSCLQCYFIVFTIENALLHDDRLVVEGIEGQLLFCDRMLLLKVVIIFRNAEVRKFHFHKSGEA